MDRNASRFLDGRRHAEDEAEVARAMRPPRPRARDPPDPASRERRPFAGAEVADNRRPGMADQRCRVFLCPGERVRPLERRDLFRRPDRRIPAEIKRCRVFGRDLGFELDDAETPARRPASGLSFEFVDSADDREPLESLRAP